MYRYICNSQAIFKVFMKIYCNHSQEMEGISTLFYWFAA